MAAETGGIVALETVPQRFGIDSAHTDGAAQNTSFFTERGRRVVRSARGA